MKSISRVLSFGLPLAAAIATISSGAAFAQTTSIPVSGTVSGTVSSTTGAVSLGSYSLLSPVGTISGTDGKVTSPTSGTIVTGGTYDVVGTSNGSIVFNDGRTASFINAPTNFNTTVTSISPGGSLTIGTLPLQDTFVGLTINSGNISIPNSSIISAPPAPRSVFFSYISSTGVTVLGNVPAPPVVIFQQRGVVVVASSDASAPFISSLSSKVSPYLNNN